MTVEAAALALRVSEVGADEVEKKLDKIDKKSTQMGAKTTTLKFTAPSIERVDNQLEQLAKQATLFQQGSQFSSTRAGSLKEMAAVEGQLKEILSGTNTTLEQRIKGEQILSTILPQNNSLFSTLTRTLGALGLVLGVGKAFSFLESIVKGAIDAGDALHDLSMRTGVSVENLSVMGQIARKSGADTETLAIGFKKLSKEVEGLRAGKKEAVETFSAIGLSAKDLEGLSLDQIMVKIADKLSMVEDGSFKSAEAMKLFGRSGDALIPTLHELADGGFERAKQKAEELGGVISTDFSNRADAFNDKVEDMHTAIGGFGRSIAELLLPRLSSFIDLLTGAAKEGATVFNILTLLSRMDDSSFSGFLAKIRLVSNLFTGNPGAAVAELLKAQPPEFVRMGPTPEQLRKGRPTPFDPEAAKKAEADRIKAIDEEIGSLVQLSSVHQLNAADMSKAIDLMQSLTAEEHKLTTSRKRRAEITKELADLEKLVLPEFKLRDVRDIRDTEHDPKLVGIDKEGRLHVPPGLQQTKPKALSRSEEMTGAALDQLLNIDSPAAQAALDIAYDKINQYISKKEPIPIEVAVRLTDLARATADVEEQFRTFLPRVGQSFFEALGAGIGSGVNSGKQMLLQALGGIFTSMGRALITYGVAMTGLNKALLNPFTSGPAAIAAGVLLVALGTKLSSIAGGGGGGSGGGVNAAGFNGGSSSAASSERNQFDVVFDPDRKLRKEPAVVPSARSLGSSPLPDARPMVYIGQINALDPDNGRWQRAVAETFNNANDRGLIKKNG